MTYRRALLALIFGGVFFLGLLVFAPASLMGYALERASGKTLSLAQTTGSLWQGSGVVLLRQHARFQTLGNYRWQLRLADASLQVQAEEHPPMSMRYLPFSRKIAIDDIQLDLPASMLEIAAPQLGPYQLQGMLDVHGQHLTLDISGMDGQLTVEWAHAASALSEIRPLGDYRIVLQGKGSTVDGQLTTLSGKLQLSANGTYDSASGLRLNGTAQAAPGDSAMELNELLHHIGPEVSPGVFALALMP
ncbi:type II secretion system protein N [Sideroxydans lithotrophicus]|uniref:Type II secretion system protein N n=1 Tax=Sideroxydans lithotrophicus (strain ES-1) TaxID=580332 RepID=D5CMB5_SIDLE|nr:type II secretion system protein N [Sideroxydans lithotrophicus]ADE10729.1 type II secretion system protein N [Sideroxydans lithotrophicus ES-1]